MTPPAHVHVGPHRFEVRADTLGELADRQADGETYAARNVILLDTQVAESVCRQTLVHELIHACLAQTGLRLDEVEDGLEERLCATLAPWLYGVLQANPALVGYLTDPDATGRVERGPA